jgi:ankyrin repeat protein
VNVFSEQGRSPLFIALERGNWSAVQLMLDRPSSPASLTAPIVNQPVNQLLPLTVAIMWGHSHLVEGLVRRGAEIDARDCHGSTALHSAALKGDIGCFDSLLELGASLEGQTAQGRKLLHILAERGATEMLRLCAVHRPAELHQALNEPCTHEPSGAYALHTAVQFGSAAAVRVLLELGADRTQRCGQNRTPSEMATALGRVHLARLIDGWVL